MRNKNQPYRSGKEMAPKSNRKPVPKDESKEAKLVRLATQRTKRIIKSIDALGNLSRLKPTEAQTEKVFGAIKLILESSYAKWKGEKPDVDFDMNTSENQAQA